MKAFQKIIPLSLLIGCATAPDVSKRPAPRTVGQIISMEGGERSQKVVPPPAETTKRENFWQRLFSARESAVKQQEREKKVQAKKIAVSKKRVGVQKSEEKETEFLTYPVSQKLYRKWIKYFSQREPERFQRHLRNAERSKLVVENIMEQYGLPKELFYVGLIESGYNTFIKSHASATGPWQFMKGTGKRYGLIINSSVDERFQLEKATEAAAKYFLDLYNIFGGWELALCAYNSGEFKVIRAIRKGNTRDLNELIRKKLLPRETRNYVPKLMAARELVRNHKKYGFSFKERAMPDELPSYQVRSSFNLKQLSRKTGLPVSLIRQVNPDIKRNRVRVPRGKSFEIYLPNHAMRKMTPTQLAQALGHGRRPRSRKVSHRRYRVKKGDTLTGIANKLEVSIVSLLRANRLGLKSKIYPGQVLRLKSAPSRVNHYIVKTGDNLSDLARRYGTTMGQIRRDNRIRGSRIYVGQRLRIRNGKNTAKYRTYKVRKGDTLFGLARRFGTSIAHLKRINSLKRPTLMLNSSIRVPVRNM